MCLCFNYLHRACKNGVVVFAGWILTLAFSPEACGADGPEQLARAFAEACATQDVQTLNRLSTDNATWFGPLGRGQSQFDAVLSNARRNSERDGAAELSSGQVVERSIQIVGETALVTELIRIRNAAPQAPRRRSLVCIRDGDAWKIAHVHSSPYTVWEPSIAAYEEQDRESEAHSGGIVFIGSSSIRGWKTLVDDFPGVPVIGRGFGGSQMIDSVLYAQRMVTRYRPRAVAVYAGDNDIAGGKSAERVLHDFRLFVESVHEDCPEARIGFIAIKPSLSRWHLWPIMLAANNLIEDMARQHPLVDFLDIGTPMLGADGRPKPELFVDDGLHLTPEGYALWTKTIQPWIEEIPLQDN